MICYIAGNSWNLAVTAVVSQHSRVAKLPSEVIDFAMLPAQRFWQQTVLLFAVMWPRSHHWECTLLEKNSQLKKKYCFIFPISFENNKSCKISMSNWVYYGGFQNSQLGHTLPRLTLMQATTTTRLASQNGSKITQWLATMVNHLFYFLSF